MGHCDHCTPEKVEYSQVVWIIVARSGHDTLACEFSWSGGIYSTSGSFRPNSRWRLFTASRPGTAMSISAPQMQHRLLGFQGDYLTDLAEEQAGMGEEPCLQKESWDLEIPDLTMSNL